MTRGLRRESVEVGHGGHTSVRFATFPVGSLQVCTRSDCTLIGLKSKIGLKDPFFSLVESKNTRLQQNSGEVLDGLDSGISLQGLPALFDVN